VTTRIGNLQRAPIWRRGGVKGFFGIAVALATAIAASQASADQAVASDDLAKFLAGMAPPPQSRLHPLTNEPNWRAAAARFNAGWSGLERVQIPRIKTWSAKHLVPDARVLVYLFSGPDFIYADALFPDARSYVLAGLEPVGEMPDILALSPSAREHALECIRAPFAHFQNYGVFFTAELKSVEENCELKGNLPLLLVALARTRKAIRSIRFVQIDPGGALEPATSGGGTNVIAGVQIDFADTKGRLHSLYYFKADLSDAGAATRGLLNFCASLGRASSLLKGASYLLHQQRFSETRDFLLKHSTTIVQDDTGVPLKYFERDRWTVRPYGDYQIPVRPFGSHYQKDLRELYDSVRPRPVDFGFGYRWRADEATLLLIRQKSKVGR
jgi:hypothetical protein